MANDPLTETAFWAQVTTDAERTVVCSPAVAEQVRAWIAAAGLGHMLTVVANPVVDDDQFIVVDHHAHEASQREFVAGLSERIRDELGWTATARDTTWRIGLIYPAYGPIIGRCGG